MAAKLPFNDLHGLRDYVDFVKKCAPDMFPEREGVGAEDRWTLDSAFAGLRFGLRMAEQASWPGTVIADCTLFIDEAEESYLVGDRRAGFTYLANLRKLLARVPQ